MKKLLIPFALVAGAAFLYNRNQKADPTVMPLPAGSPMPGTIPGSATPPIVAPAPAPVIVPYSQLAVGMKLAAAADTYVYTNQNLSSASMLNGYYPTGNYIGTVTAKGQGNSWVKVTTYKAPFPTNDDGEPINTFYIPPKSYKLL